MQYSQKIIDQPNVTKEFLRNCRGLGEPTVQCMPSQNCPPLPSNSPFRLPPPRNEQPCRWKQDSHGEKWCISTAVRPRYVITSPDGYAPSRYDEDWIRFGSLK